MSSDAAHDQPSALHLVRSADGVALHDDADGQRPFRIDLTDFDLRTGAGNLSRKQPLARALGEHNETVIDATAGFGHDAALMALLGWRVTAVERHPTVAALLQDALERALEDSAFGPRYRDRLTVHHGNAITLLPSLAPADVVYVDPMYPPKKRRSALPPKAAQLLRRLVGDDDDAANLVAAARAAALQRVVVKRPVHAEPLADSPSHTITSKLVRYDVYISAR